MPATSVLKRDAPRQVAPRRRQRLEGDREDRWRSTVHANFEGAQGMCSVPDWVIEGLTGYGGGHGGESVHLLGRVKNHPDGRRQDYTEE